MNLNNLDKHLGLFPPNSHLQLLGICADHDFELKITKKRASKLGDFTYPKPGETPRITLNDDVNLYRNLITFLHELAHMLVWLGFGRVRNPHGTRWKRQFARLLHIFHQAGLFPPGLDKALEKHILNPKASTHADAVLLEALRKYDGDEPQLLLIDLPENHLFKLSNGKVFQKGQLRRTRVMCREVKTRRRYLIHAYAEVVSVE